MVHRLLVALLPLAHGQTHDRLRQSSQRRQLSAKARQLELTTRVAQGSGDFDAEVFEEVELDAAGDVDGGPREAVPRRPPRQPVPYPGQQVLSGEVGVGRPTGR